MNSRTDTENKSLSDDYVPAEAEDRERADSASDIIDEGGVYSLRSEGGGQIFGEADVTQISLSEEEVTHDYMIQFDGRPSILKNESGELGYQVEGKDRLGQQEFEQTNSSTQYGASSMTLTEENSLLANLFSSEYPQSIPYSISLSLVVYALALSSPAMALVGSLLLITTKLHYGG